MFEELLSVVRRRVHNFCVIDLAFSTLSNIREVLADLHMCRHGSNSRNTRAVPKLLLLPRIV